MYLFVKGTAESDSNNFLLRRGKNHSGSVTTGDGISFYMDVVFFLGEVMWALEWGGYLVDCV